MIEQKTISKTCGCEKSQFRCWFSCCLMFRSELAGPGLTFTLQCWGFSHSVGTFLPLPWMFYSPTVLHVSLSHIGSMASELSTNTLVQIYNSNTYTWDLITNSCCQIDQRMFLRKCFFFYYYFLNVRNVRNPMKISMPWPGWRLV